MAGHPGYVVSWQRVAAAVGMWNTVVDRIAAYLNAGWEIVTVSNNTLGGYESLDIVIVAKVQCLPGQAVEDPNGGNNENWH